MADFFQKGYEIPEATKEEKAERRFWWMYAHGSGGKKRFARRKLVEIGYDDDYISGQDDGEPPVDYSKLK